MKYDEVPDRRIGLVAGLIGGLVGMAALRVYMREIEPSLLPKFQEIEARPLGDVLDHHELDNIALIGPHYRPGEASSATAGRVLYQQLTGTEPEPATQAALTDLMQWTWGLLAGGAYGGSRTTTAPRDLASGFFYGIRLWMGDTLISALLGLRPSPTILPVSEHIKRLVRCWVFTFITTQATRLLYLFFDPNAWADLK